MAITKRGSSTKRKKTARSKPSSRKKIKGSIQSLWNALMIRLGTLTVAALLTAGIYYYFLQVSDDKTPKGLKWPSAQVNHSKETKSVTKKTSKKIPTSPSKSKIDYSSLSATDRSTYHFGSNFEIPHWTVRKKEELIRHIAYTVSYNSDYKIPNWVAYELTEKEESNKNYSRTNRFVRDPLVKGASASNEDYSHTGYDRGHMAPAADMRWSMRAMQESFYLSNMCPQKPGLNRGIWSKLEEQCRLWVKDRGRIFIISGPINESKPRRLGKNRVVVPPHFFKVVATASGNHPCVMAFVFDNKDYKEKNPEKFEVTVDEVEKLTGLDFFSLLPDNIENVIESKIVKKPWPF